MPAYAIVTIAVKAMKTLAGGRFCIKLGCHALLTGGSLRPAVESAVATADLLRWLRLCR